MLNMCQLCQNQDKVKAVNLDEPDKNQCFEARRFVENYAPFKNSKETARLTCRHFSHIKTAVINFKGGGRRVIRATPAAQNVDLSDLPMFKNDLSGEDEGMTTLFCGINETAWNHQRTNPGAFACIAPVYGSSEETRRENRVRVPGWTRVRQDSGAFSDGPKSRLSFSEALDRQLEHGHKFGYHDQIIDRASYDLLIDEVWTNDNRHKRRWSENDAWAAVKATVDAAAYLSKNYTGARVLSAQGVTDKQYLDCALRVLEWFDPAADVFGLGGWCISGKMPSVMREPFDDTMNLVIPTLAGGGVKRVHIWGVMDSLFLGPLLYLCDDYGLQLSTDSSGPSVRPANGEWGYKGWRNLDFKRPDPIVRGIFRALHVSETRRQLAKLRQTKYYRAPVIRSKQLILI